MTILPGTAVPTLSLPTVSGRDWSQASDTATAFTMVVFYRGFHCPKCKEQLLDLQTHLADLQAVGTSVTAISMDPADRAERTRDEWGLQQLEIAHSLTETQAREWGLFISSSRGKTSMGVEETKIFCEPGLFLVRPPSHADAGTLYASWVQSVPFARPPVADLISMIKFVADKDYPPRGTVSG